MSFDPLSGSWRADLGAPLSPREKQVLPLLAQGWKLTDIAKILGVTVGSVSNQRQRILAKLGCDSDQQLAVYAFRKRLIRWPFEKPGSGRNERQAQQVRA